MLVLAAEIWNDRREETSEDELRKVHDKEPCSLPPVLGLHMISAYVNIHLCMYKQTYGMCKTRFLECVLKAFLYLNWRKAILGTEGMQWIWTTEILKQPSNNKSTYIIHIRYMWKNDKLPRNTAKGGISVLSDLKKEIPTT